jgi:tetratricopeptide (TPR) repeat protein/transcriptional regulator with XRE-family HTH domain
MAMAAPSSMTFADLLRHHRMAAGLTQAELAARAQLSLDAISTLERGARRRPRKDTIALLAEALALPAEERAAFAAAARRLPTESPLIAPAGTSAVMHTGGALPGRPALAPLVGRARELAWLEQHLTEGPPLLAIAGEPGIGKTRLLHEEAERARTAGWTVLQGGCHRRTGQEPYAPLIEALARYIAKLPLHQLRADLLGCAWLARLLPELAEASVVPAPGWVLAPAQDRRLMFAAVRRFLENVAGPAGTLLLLDDLQWAGEDALDLLTTLAQVELERPLRAVAAYRETEVRPQDSFGLLLADLSRDELAAQLELSALSDGEAEELLGRLLGPATTGDAAMRAQILRRSAGVPFFLVSSARSLHVAKGDAAAQVPWDVGQSIRQRMAAVPATAQHLLGIAAIIGRAAPAGLLVEVSDQPEEEVLVALDAVSQARLLVPEIVQVDAYQFAHDLIREVVEADLSPARRTALHRRVAHALERRAEHERLGWAEDLAYHFVVAGEEERALPYALLAGDQAEALFAHHKAARHYRSALTLAQAQHDLAHEAEALEKLGRVLRMLARNDEAIDALRRAVSAYRAAADSEGWGRAAEQLGRAHLDRGTAEEGGAWLESQLVQLRAAGLSAKGLAPAYLALAQLRFFTGHYFEQRVAAEHAMQLARESQAISVREQAEQQHLIADVFLGNQEKFVAIGKSVAQAEAAGNSEALCIALIFGAHAAETAGAPKQAAGYIEHASAIAERLDKPDLLAAAYGQQGYHAFSAGRWREAHSALERAEALTHSLGESWFAPVIRCHLGYLCLVEGQDGEGIRRLEEAIALGQRTGNLIAERWANYRLAEWDIVQGRPHAARQRIESIAEEEAQRAGHGTRSAMLAWALLDLGEVASAEALAAKAVAFIVGDIFGRATALSIHAMILTRQERWQEAGAALDEALAYLQVISNPFAEARVLYIYGRFYAAQGEYEQARARFDAALAILNRLGERLYATHIERILAHMDTG